MVPIPRGKWRPLLPFVAVVDAVVLVKVEIEGFRKLASAILLTRGGLPTRRGCTGAARDQDSSDRIGMMHTKRSNHFRTRRASVVDKRFYSSDFCLLDF